jgi:hypothetical protein
MSDTLPEGTHALVMARIDRAKIRAAIGSQWVGEEDDPKLLGGIRIRVNPYIPEGLMAIEDRHGNLLGVVDTRGDHDPSFAPAGSRSVLQTELSKLAECE